MIGLCTDSASMLPAELKQRFGIGVVPMHVALDGQERPEPDYDVDDFFDQLEAGATVTTAAPSPGEFVDEYRRLAAGGANEIVSIHTGSEYSAVVASATTAAELVDVPVTIVDTGQVSFPVAMCVWEAALAAEHGDIAEVADTARSASSRTASVFIVGVPELARRGGRFSAVTDGLEPTSILLFDADGFRELSTAPTPEAAVDAMAAHVAAVAADTSCRVGVGDAQRPELAAQFLDRLTGAPGINGLTRYTVGPSVAAHTGVGTIGAVYTRTVPT